jgi:hypothetical protein
VESVVREVCDRIIYEESKADKETVLKRVAALEILGSVYATARKEESMSDDYVKIEATKK